MRNEDEMNETGDVGSLIRRDADSTVRSSCDLVLRRDVDVVIKRDKPAMRGEESMVGSGESSIRTGEFSMKNGESNDRLVDYFVIIAYDQSQAR